MAVAEISISMDPAPPWSAPVAGPLALLGIAVALVALTLWTYRGLGVSRPRMLAVVALRLAALAVAVITVLRPSLAIREEDKTPSKLILAIDHSKSMSVADEVDNKSRWMTAERALHRSQDALDRLNHDFNVTLQTHYFAGDVIDDKPEPDGPRTDFGQMLRALANRYGQERALRGLIVLSDGADNGTRYPAQGEAARFRALNCPIYTFALGKQNTSVQQRDLAITAATADPSPAPIKGRLAVRVNIDAPGFQNTQSVVRLLFDGNEVVAKPTLLTKEAGNEVILEANAPPTPGEIKLTVKVDPRAGEASTANNELTTYLTVSKEGLSVLVIDRLRLELKYIRRALAGDPRIRLFEAVRQTDDPPRGAAAEAYNFDRQAYDAIIIGDVSARRLAGGDPAVWARIEELVRVRGTGLLMIGGQDSFGAGGWAATPVGDALPVRMDSAGQVDEPVQLLPVPEARNDYLLRIGADVAASEALWRRLPALPGYSRMGRRKDGAATIGQSAGGVPLLVRQNYGQGRTAAFALDMTYLWQQLGQTARPRTSDGIDAHARFWRQMVLWLAKQEETEGSVWVKPDARRIPVGDKLNFTVGVRGKTGLDLPSAKYQVTVTGPNAQAPEPVPTAPDKGLDRGTFAKAEAPGEYTVKVKGEAKDADGATVTGEATARFLAYQDDTELLRPAADFEFLTRLAAAGGGQAFLADELPKFLDNLAGQPLDSAAAKTRHLPDWRSARLGAFPPSLLILFVALLGAEWGLRRWWGMV